MTSLGPRKSTILALQDSTNDGPDGPRPCHDPPEPVPQAIGEQHCRVEGPDCDVHGPKYHPGRELLEYFHVDLLYPPWVSCIHDQNSVQNFSREIFGEQPSGEISRRHKRVRGANLSGKIFPEKFAWPKSRRRHPASTQFVQPPGGPLGERPYLFGGPF